MLSNLFKWLTTRTPGLPRKKIQELPPEPVEPVLPQRKEIKVRCELRRMQPLAQVRKGWSGSLKLLFSLYISNDYEKPEKEAQALQVCLHELMHIAFWDTDIRHSTDEKSILFAYITGENISPIAWDLENMKAAADRIDTILIDASRIAELPIFGKLQSAIDLWNRWLGRELFRLL